MSDPRNDEVNDVVSGMVAAAMAEADPGGGDAATAPAAAASATAADLFVSEDALKALLDQEGLPDVFRIIGTRLLAVEEQLPGVVGVGRALNQLGSRVEELARMVQHLSQQRGMAEMQLERQTRLGALDLAIKAVPESIRASATGAGTVTALAEGFLGWVRASEH